MGLADKYRPKKLEDMVGNEGLKRDIRPFFTGKRKLPEAFLFIGQYGCGKTTLAKLIASRFAKSRLDVKEMNSADFRGIDSARDIIQDMKYSSFSGGKRWWIIDECHKLTKDAQDALLKALESPPKDTHFALCTTEPQNLLKTLVSRCVIFDVEPLGRKDLITMLQRICQGEGAKISTKVLEGIARRADSSGRAAISMLERVIGRDTEDQEAEIDTIKRAEAQVTEVCQCLLKQKPWKTLVEKLSVIKEEPETIRRICLEYMYKVMINPKSDKNTTARAALVVHYMQDPFYNSGKAGLILACRYILIGEE